MKSVKISIAVASLAASAGLGSTLIAPVAATPRTGGVSACTSADLKAFGHGADDSAGHIAIHYGFKNTSSADCSLRGYPKVKMLGALKTRPKHAPRSAFRIHRSTVDIAPGKRAYFVVYFADQTGYGNETCPTSAGLDVTPPHTSPALAVHGRWSHIQPYGGSIEHLRCGQIQITPVTSDKADF